MDTDKKVTVSFLKRLFPSPSRQAKIPVVLDGLRKTAYDALTKGGFLTAPGDFRESMALWIYRDLSRQVTQELLEGKIKECGGRPVSKRSMTNVAVGLAVFLEWRVAPIAGTGKSGSHIPSNWQEAAKSLTGNERIKRWYGLKEKHLTGFLPRSNSSFYEYMDKGLACLADAMNRAVIKHMADAMEWPERAPTLYQEAFAQYQHAVRRFLETVPGQRKSLSEVFVPPYLVPVIETAGYKDQRTSDEADDGKSRSKNVPHRFSGEMLKSLNSNLWITGPTGSGKSTLLRHIGLAAPPDTAVVWIPPEQAAEIHRGSTVDEVMAGSIRTLRRKGVQVSEEAALALRASRSKLFLVDLGAEWVSPGVLKKLQVYGRVIAAAGHRLPVALSESHMASGERKWREFRIQEWPLHELRRLARAYGDRTSRDVGKLLEIAGIPHYPLWIVLAIQAGQKIWSSGTDLVREFVENRAMGDERSEGYLKTLRHLAWLKQIRSDEIPTRARTTVPWAQERGLLVGGGDEEIEFPHDLILHFLAADHLARKASNDPSSVGEAMEAVFGTAGWSDVVRMAVEILANRRQWRSLAEVLSGLEKLVSKSWQHMAWIWGADAVGSAWKAVNEASEEAASWRVNRFSEEAAALSKAKERERKEIEAAKEIVHHIYFNALNSLKRLLRMSFWTPEHQFTDAVSGGIAALEPLPLEEADLFAKMVISNPFRFWGASPLPSTPEMTKVIKERLFKQCSQETMKSDMSCADLFYRLAKRKALSVPETLSMCKKGMRWQDIFLALASLGSKEAARFLGSVWPTSGRIGDERVDLEKVLGEWSGDPWNMLEMLDSMMKKRNLWQVYVRSLMRATRGEALFELPLDKLASARLPVLFYDSMTGIDLGPEVIERLVQMLSKYTDRKFALEDPSSWTAVAIYETLFDPGQALAAMDTDALLVLLRRYDILMNRYPVQTAEILRKRLPDKRISTFGRELLEGQPDEWSLAAAIRLLDKASKKEIWEWMHHENPEVVAGAISLADRLGMTDLILELLDEKTLDYFLGAYSLEEALEEVLPHLPPEKVAGIVGKAVTEKVKRGYDALHLSSMYRSDTPYEGLVKRLSKFPPDIVDESLKELWELMDRHSVTTLCHAGAPKSVERVIQWYLETKDREIRNGIRDIIHSEVKNPAALPVLIKYMVESPDAELRWGCARAVENIVVDGYARKIPPAVWKAILQCQDDPDRFTSEVCSRVLRSTSLRELLPHLNAKNLREALCWYLSEESSGSRVNALDLWYYARKAGLDVRCSEDVLFGLMEDTNPRVRKAAMELLEVYPLPEALQRARDMLKYEADDGVRRAIVGALAYLGYEEDFDLLLGLALNPHSSYEESSWAKLALVRHPVYWKHLLKRVDSSPSGREILDAMVTIQAWRRGCILMGRVGNWKCVGREQDVD